MRDYKNRIAAMLQKAMRETALTKLKALQAAHADATNGKMFDGPAMLDAMRRDANAKLAAGDDETERVALSELGAVEGPCACWRLRLQRHGEALDLLPAAHQPVPAAAYDRQGAL